MRQKLAKEKDTHGEESEQERLSAEPFFSSLEPRSQNTSPSSSSSSYFHTEKTDFYH